MDIGHFYFLTDDYFKTFPDTHLMGNSETVNGVKHGRPAFYSFKDPKTQITWVIPISCRVSKYKKIYQDKISKYKVCDTIAFGYVLGQERAFLIQNMCPIIPKYVDDEYMDSLAKIPVKVDGVFEAELIKKASKVLALHRKGTKLIFPDVLSIERQLLEELNPK